MAAMIICAYFLIGVALFILFWRYISKDNPGESADTFTGIMILILWPVVLWCLILVGTYWLLLKVAAMVKR